MKQNAKDHPEKKAKVSEAPRKSAIVYGGLLFCLATLIWYTIYGEQKGVISSEVPQPSQLLKEIERCSETGDVAISSALELEEAAVTKMQRYPFHVYEGVKAYELMQRAVNCYLSGDDRESAANLEKRLRAWKASLEQRYQNHQIRLRLALDRKAYPDALRDIHILQSLLKGRKGSYVKWLVSVERQIDSMSL